METIVLLLCLLVVGYFVFRFIRRVRAERMRDDIGMPSALQHALYVSSESSGRSLKNWRTRFAAANNCLKIVVTGDSLYTGVPNPLLRTVTRKYDLEHRIAKTSIEAIEPRRHWLSKRSYRIRYRDGRGEVHTIELWPKRREEFEQALGNVGFTADKP